MVDLAELERRLSEATGADRKVDAIIYRDFVPCEEPDCLPDVKARNVERVLAGGDGAEIPAYTASLDAAIALVEEKLPGCLWSMNSRGMAHIWLPEQGFFHEPAGCVPKDNAEPDKPPAIAVLLALIRALIEKEGTDG